MRHSTKSYSEDLRKRVVAGRLCGMKVSEVMALYQVDDNSVYRWVARYKETGSYIACNEANASLRAIWLGAQRTALRSAQTRQPLYKRTL